MSGAKNFKNDVLPIFPFFCHFVVAGWFPRCFGVGTALASALASVFASVLAIAFVVMVFFNTPIQYFQDVRNKGDQ